jgi:hypothetical protein
MLQHFLEMLEFFLPFPHQQRAACGNNDRCGGAREAGRMARGRLASKGGSESEGGGRKRESSVWLSYELWWAVVGV